MITSDNNDKLIICIKIILFLALVYFPIFLDLDVLPLRVWDEARAAISAIEMKNNGNFIVPYYEGQPDMWVTKPPLMIWLQVLSLKFLGIGELAVRLPSAIAALLTAIVIMLFSVKYIKSYWFGLIAVLVLVTSNGYVHDHATRTGDYDSLLTLFITSYCISFFLYLQKNDTKYLHLFFLTIALAIFTKGFQGVLFLPGIFIYVLIDRKFIQVIKNKWLYIDFIICLAIVASYYLLREHYTPGYLKRVVENELGTRYTTVIEGHQGEFSIYLNQIIHYDDWYWLIPVGMILGIFLKNNILKPITIFSTILIVSYCLLISFAKTKVDWYIVPLFPFIAIVCAVAIFWVFSFLKNSIAINKQFQSNIIPLAFLFIFFLHPYETIIDKVYFPKEEGNGLEYRISYFLKEALESQRTVNNEVLCYNEHRAHLSFYLIQLNQKGQNISFKDWRLLTQGETAIASQWDVQNYIENHYDYKILDTYYNVKTYKILNKLIHLKAMNGKYVCADEGLDHKVMANKDNAQSWETFSVNIIDKNYCTILSSEKLYFTAELDKQGEIFAKKTYADEWERFSKINIDSNTIALKAANGKYLTVDENSRQLFARSDSIGKNETFKIVN